MRKRTSSANGDPARVAFANRTRDANAIRDTEVHDEAKVTPQPPSRPGATRHSPKHEPGDPGQVAAANRRKRAVHKNDSQQLKR